MDITPQDTTTQPMSDDQELAKALAGVLPDEPDAPVSTDTPASTGMAFEETSTTIPSVPSVEETPVISSFTPQIGISNDLESIKKDALGELRPLIDHVDLPAEEKFDTYLMLIRSTDDPTLIAPAHTAAQGISDEKRRAEALLDIIKEIDFLSRKDQPTT